MLGVNANHWFGSWSKPRPVGGTAEEIAKELPPSDWRRLSAGAGTRGSRLHDWCYLELADLEADEFNDDNHSLWTRGLLIRRTIADGDLPLGAQRGRRSRRWSMSKAIAGLAAKRTDASVVSPVITAAVAAPAIAAIIAPVTTAIAAFATIAAIAIVALI